MNRLWLIFLVLFAAGCGAPLQLPASVESPAAEIVETAVLPQVTDTPELKPVSVNCAYVWSTRSLPEISRQVTAALRALDMPEVEVEASAYGEDCIDSATNEVVRFSAMQTDFFFTVVVADTGSRELLGLWVERIYQALEAFPPGGEIPGPNPGYVGITFSSGGDPVNLWFPRTLGEQALKEGLRGSALLDALAPPR